MTHSQRLAALLAAAFLAACTGPGNVVEPSSLQPLSSDDPQAPGELPPPGGAAASGVQGAGNVPVAPARQVAAIQTDARVQFAPVIGVSADAVPALAARLRARAQQLGITVAAAADRSITHVMKGYFSAFTEGRETTVIYVWDVLDPAGSRLHRIQGQQKQPGSDGEGWNSVTAPTMEAIADRTIDDLAVWLSSSPG